MHAKTNNTLRKMADRKRMTPKIQRKPLVIVEYEVAVDENHHEFHDSLMFFCLVYIYALPI